MAKKRPDRFPQRDEDFGPDYTPTEDEEMLIERADYATRFIKGHFGDVDPLEMLVAVVWPSPEMLHLQRVERDSGN